MFRRDARTGVGYNSFDMSIDQCGDAQPAAAWHRFLGVQKKIEKHLLQFAGVAVDRRQVFDQFRVDDNLRRLELVLQQRQRIANDLV